MSVVRSRNDFIVCHLLEMCGHSATAELWPEALPFFAEAAEYAEDFLLTAAGQRNRNFFGKKGDVSGLSFAVQELMFDPQTSGGLLICADPDEAPELLSAIQRDDPSARMIGRILPRAADTIVFAG